MKKLMILFCMASLFHFKSIGQVCVSNTVVSNPITLNTVSNDTIEGLRIMNPNGQCIALYYCKNIVIKNCILGPSQDEGVFLYDCDNVTIINCSFENNGSGVRANFGSKIQVIDNQFLNVLGQSNYFGNYIQLGNISGGGNRVNNNVCESIPGMSKPEDLISIYKSSGTYNDPIQVKGNKLRGGGPSTSSGGIMVGDVGGSYITVEDNILVDPGQYGIAISSGSNNKIIDNTIYAKQQSFTNVGIYVWNQYSTGCSNNTVSGNKVNWTDKNGNKSPKWDGGNCGTISGWSQNDWNANIDESILPEQLLCPDLVAYYKFDNDFLDTSGNKLNGSNNGGVTFSKAGKSASASFDGSNDYLAVTNSTLLKPTTSLTISVWIRPHSFQNVKGIIKAPDADGVNSGWRIVLNGSKLEASIVTSKGTKTLDYGNLKADKWVNVVLIYDGQKIKGILNGIVKDSVDFMGDIQYKSSEVMKIGYANNTGSNFDGQMDELKIYRGFFSHQNVIKAYNSDMGFFSNTIVMDTTSTKDTSGNNTQNGLIAYYKFNNNLKDASGNNHNGTNNGGMTFSNSGNSYSADFDGSNDYVSVSSSQSLKSVNKMTISLWIKPHQLNGVKGVIKAPSGNGWNSGWRIILDGNQLAVRFVTSKGGKSLYCDTLSLNKWNFVTVSYDGQQVKGYIDGKLKASTSQAGDIYYSGSSDMKIGYSDGGSSYYFNGEIDELKLYGNVFSSQDIADNYEAEKKAFFNNSTNNSLIAYYKFDNNFKDSSGNNHDGTDNGGITFSNSGNSYSADFDGSDDYVSVSSSQSLKPTNEITISLWIKPHQLKGVKGIMRSPDGDGWNSGWRMILDSNQFAVRFITENGGKSLYCDTLTVNHWNHVVVSYDGQQARGYVGGLLKASTSLTGDIYYKGSADMKIGYSDGGSSYYFDGEIDELKIYGEALDSDSVADIFDSEKVSFYGTTTSPNANVLCLDGSGYLKVDKSSTLDVKNDFTFETWVKTNSDPDYWTEIIEFGENGLGVHFALKKGGYKLYANIKEENGSSHIYESPKNVWTPNSCQHIALTRSGGTIYFYVNGKQYAATNMSGGSIGNAKASTYHNVYIGARYNNGAILSLTGSLDELRIWKTALSTSQIKNYMNKELSGNESNLEAYYTFNGSNSSIAADLSSNGNNAKLMSGANKCKGTFCFDSSQSKKSLEAISIPEKSNTSSLKAFPNPFSKSLSIVYEVKNNGNVSASVFDVNGRKITDLVKISYMKPGIYTAEWANSSNSPDGIYFIQLISGNEVHRVKVVKVSSN